MTEICQEHSERENLLIFFFTMTAWFIVDGSRERLDLGLGERKNYRFFLFFVGHQKRVILLYAFIGGHNTAQQRDNDI